MSALCAPGHATAASTPSITWPNTPPSGSPFPRSTKFSGVTFPGPYATYATADTWYPSWGADGKLYSPYMDGLCDASGSYGGTPNPESAVGTAVISGDDPLKLNVSCSTHVVDRSGWDGRYASASLNYHGIWYYGTYLLDNAPQPGGKPCTGTYCTLGPFVGFDTSSNGGLTWQSAPETTSSPLFGESIAGGHRVELGALHFVDFGRDMQYSPDGYAYLVGHGGGGPTANNSWVAGSNVYLIRVKPSPATINDPHAYEFYAGQANGQPVWSQNLADMQPLISWPGHLGSTTITYDPSLHTYLMWVTTPSDGLNTAGTFDQILLESDSLTGPWRLVDYMARFGPQAYFLNVPSKFISGDGRTMWLSYSANYENSAGASTPPGSQYSWVLREMTLDSAVQAPSSSTGPSSLGCRRARAPVARLTRPIRLSRTRARIVGRARARGCGRVAEVDVSIVRLRRRHRCQFVNAAGALTAPRSCLRAIYIVASGTRRWSLKLLLHRLPAGTYLIHARAVGGNGRIERRTHRNMARKRIR